MVLPRKRQKWRIIMKIKAYKNYNDEVEFDVDTVLVSLWNAYIEAEGRDKIYLNNKDFFNRTFESPYDAAWAVSLSGKWARSDDYVYFNKEGYLTSFSHWDDDSSPINLDKLDISQLINSLKNRYVVSNVSRAIHDALE